ncbi:MAG: hypothetical protein ACOCYZ_00915 [Halococcoides sp.]
MTDEMPALEVGWLGPADPPGVDLVEPSRADAVATDGRAGVREALAAGHDPILAVDPPGAMPGVTRDRLGEAIAALAGGRWTLARQPVIVAAAGSRTVRAAVDLAVVADSPDHVATITVAADGLLDRVRADGVVVTTPAGSTRYARAVGGPVMTDGRLGVVPMGPFETDPDHWVLETVAITVDGPATVVADGAAVAELPGECSIEVGATDSIGLIDPGIETDG